MTTATNAMMTTFCLLHSDAAWLFTKRQEGIILVREQVL